MDSLGFKYIKNKNNGKDLKGNESTRKYNGLIDKTFSSFLCDLVKY